MLSSKAGGSTGASGKAESNEGGSSAKSIFALFEAKNRSQ